ncbi:MAG: RNA polymerase sigma-70 factor [Spirosomaceae bacterium]|jgi:RNA polymerase sigma-70 factor (ECF subfamily)|nr:RNA polymerase sigma-70 factor [Spirosomataceae bacterium]
MQTAISDISDEQLVLLLLNEDRDAFTEIYERYWKKLLGMAIYKTNDKEVAQEIVQELFVSLWEKRKTTVIQNLENYLFVSLKYLIIHHLKRVIAERKLVNTEGVEIPNEPTEILTAQALQNAISQAVEQLPDKTQLVFRMSRFEEKSHKEIAEFLEISEKAVEYHITQSLKFLKSELKEFLI